jgi:hypothetical protein
MLKNFLCEPTTSLVELVRSNYQDSEEPFKHACEHLLKYYSSSSGVGTRSS